MNNIVLQFIALALQATSDLRQQAAEAVGTWLADTIPGDVVEDELADFLEDAAGSLRSSSSAGSG